MLSIHNSHLIQQELQLLSTEQGVPIQNSIPWSGHPVSKWLAPVAVKLKVGLVIDCAGGCLKDVDAYIAAATALFWDFLQPLWRHWDIRLVMKLQIYRTTVMPALFYSREMGAPRKAESGRLTFSILITFISCFILSGRTRWAIRIPAKPRNCLHQHWFGLSSFLGTDRLGSKTNQWRSAFTKECHCNVNDHRSAKSFGGVIRSPAMNVLPKHLRDLAKDWSR